MPPAPTVTVSAPDESPRTSSPPVSFTTQQLTSTSSSSSSSFTQSISALSPPLSFAERVKHMIRRYYKWYWRRRHWLWVRWVCVRVCARLCVYGHQETRCIGYAREETERAHTRESGQRELERGQSSHNQEEGSPIGSCFRSPREWQFCTSCVALSNGEI